MLARSSALSSLRLCVLAIPNKTGRPSKREPAANYWLRRVVRAWVPTWGCSPLGACRLARRRCACPLSRDVAGPPTLTPRRALVLDIGRTPGCLLLVLPVRSIATLALMIERMAEARAPAAEPTSIFIEIE